MTPTQAAHASAPGLRDRQKRQRRGDMVDAAQQIALEHGIDAVTVEEVCARAGVSRRTFFNYFDSREDAVLALHAVTLPDDAAETFASGGPSGDLLTDVAALVQAIEDGLGEDRARVHCARRVLESEPRLMVHHAVWMDRLRERLTDLAARRLDQAGEGGADAADVVTGLVLTTAFLTAERVRGRRSDGTAAEVVTDLRRLLDG